MAFSSPTFLFAFLPAALLLTWAAPARARRYVLIVASAVFYWWGVQEFLLLVWASTLVDWAIARRIARHRAAGRPGPARRLLVAAIVQNVALLGYYKYAGFLSGQVDHLAELFGGAGVGVISVALPIGISFFTFEKISYVVDVHRGDVQARRDPTDVLLFVSLFPRSIAGPIVRLREAQGQLRAPSPTSEDAREGAIRFAHGLAKKVLVADQLAPVANAAFASASSGDLTTPAAWIGILAYTLQLYFDFSGYSDMAIGIARMLGFTIPENFRRPYAASSMTDFWRRWHMTLSRWFRDYVYIPLGGSRGTPFATYRNLTVVFLLTGLWHGAAWTFVLWGAYHGAWLVVERRGGWREAGDGAGAVAPRRASTFLIVLVGWVLFRAGTLGVAVDFYRAMLDLRGGMTPAVDAALTNRVAVTLALASLIVFAPAREAGGLWLARAQSLLPSAARAATLGLALPLSLAYALGGSFSPFLYFRF